MFHKIKTVAALPNYVLLAHFADGSEKKYDMKPLMREHEIFRTFETVPGLFEQVRADVGGYGVVWNEDIDLDAEEIWVNGKEARTPFFGLISLADATVLWNLNESTLRKAISYGKLKTGTDVFNFGSQWVVTASAMEREYGAVK